MLPGRFPIHDLPDIGVELPEGDYNTVAGLVLDLLGRIPTAGDAATIDGWRLEVRAMRGRAVTEVSLTPVAREPGGPPPTADLEARKDGGRMDDGGGSADESRSSPPGTVERS